MLYSEKVRVFLTRHNMEPERIDLAETTAAFLGEMELGLRGRESSLKMLPTYLTADGVLPMDEPAAVIDAGGTNFRTALVSFTEAGPVIDSLNVCAMPGTDGAVTWEDFISFAADRLAPAGMRGIGVSENLRIIGTHFLKYFLIERRRRRMVEIYSSFYIAHVFTSPSFPPLSVRCGKKIPRNAHQTPRARYYR